MGFDPTGKKIGISRGGGGGIDDSLSSVKVASIKLQIIGNLNGFQSERLRKVRPFDPVQPGKAPAAPDGKGHLMERTNIFQSTYV